MAVNMGDDTDTTASVTGGLAGLYYGLETIPTKWINEIKRSNEIESLCDRLSKAMGVWERKFMEKQLKNISKLMSLVLRHEPEHIGLTLDQEGWASVPVLIEKINKFPPEK